MRLLPNSLFGRLVLVFLTGLILAQLLSAFVLLRDRGQALYGSIQENLINRTAGIVRLLNSLPAPDRQRLIPVLAGPDLQITLSAQPTATQASDQEADFTSKLVIDQLSRRLPEVAEVRVSLDGAIADQRMPSMHRRHMMGGARMSGPWAYMHGLHAMARHFNIQVQLVDESWVRFERRVSEHLFNWPSQLLLVLSVLLVSVIALSLFGVRSIIRPLNSLRNAAEGLGKDIRQPALPEAGPVEVTETARAFNTMQRRLKNYIEDRASILAAVSHDLKTPLTRLRLRTDLMDDDELREKTLKDLDDMESMVSATLDFMRGTETSEPSQRIDLLALIESITEDACDTGKNVQITGQPAQPYQGKPLALKRCIVNLVENAVHYGKRASIEIEDNETEVVVSICDDGPGIAEDNLEKVFNPFFRLETSRAKHTGGTGLGLGIARNIARAHGGDLILHNRTEGGLCAELKLPR